MTELVGRADRDEMIEVVPVAVEVRDGGPGVMVTR